MACFYYDLYCWHALAGERVADLRKNWLGQSFKRCVKAVLYFVYETIDFWLQQESDRKLSDVMWPEWSPRTGVDNLFSLLLSSGECGCKVTELLVRHAGYSSFMQMMQFAKEDAEWFRCIVIQAGAAFELWWGSFDNDTNLLGIVADQRRSNSDRCAAFDKFMRTLWTSMFSFWQSCKCLTKFVRTFMQPSPCLGTL